jgi:hypothetical protein
VTKSAKTRDNGRSRSTRTSGAATTRKRKRAAKRKANASAVSAPPNSMTSEQPTRQEEAALVEALIASGEAARLDEQGRLPAGATHKIVEDQAGNMKVVRRRFSMT